jgi:hypothetical protein
MTNTATSQRSSRARYGFQYWTIILVLNLIAAFKGEGLDKILFVDGLILAVFGTAAILTRVWPTSKPQQADEFSKKIGR